jgi:hypothetical protein
VVHEMTPIRPTFRAAAALVMAGLSTACIINSSDDDAGQDTEATDDGPVADDGVDDGDGTGVDDGDDGDDGTGDGMADGGFPMECGTDPLEITNYVVDGSFEAGTPSEVWTEASLLFGTPICDTASCSDDEGAMPAEGDFWAWFGGSETEPEVASLAQTLTIPANDVAQLSFFLRIPSGAGGGDDILTVSLDQQIQFMVTDLDMPEYGDYRLVEIDVTDFADGQSHELLIEADITGAGLTSFFVDDFYIVSCGETAADTTAGDDTAGTDTGADDTAGGTDTGTDSGTATGTGTGTDTGSESDTGTGSTTGG